MSRFELVNTLWALQKLRIRHWSPEPLVKCFIGMVDEADEQNCSNFIYACHMLGWDE